MELDESKTADVLSAAKAGSISGLQAALNDLPDVSIDRVRDSKGRTALHAAAQQNQEQLCQQLIDTHNCDVNAQDTEGDTPLALAAFAGHEPIVDLLLARGADANRHAQGSAAPLHRAALAGHASVAQRLLAGGADVHGGAAAGAPIAWAAGAGQAGVVDVLLRHGADPDGKGQNGVTPLLMAAAIGSTPTVRSLVGGGAQVATPGPGGVTALHVAANSGSVEMVRCLLEAGASPDAVDEQGRTPARVAAAAGHRPVVEVLLGRAGGKDKEAGMEETVDALMSKVKEEEEKAQQAGAPAGGSSVVIPPPDDPNQEAAERERKRGNQLFAAGQFAEAAEAYSAALRHNTRTAATWANRAACFLRLDKAEEALHDAMVARVLDVKYVKAWYREGQAAERLERWEDAALGYYEAYLLQPENEEFAMMMKRVINKGRREQGKPELGAAAGSMS
ncbi:hypothetical protein N2152v2_000827 [Parachlorella kessleri]